jgi:hypothetical protein
MDECLGIVTVNISEDRLKRVGGISMQPSMQTTPLSEKDLSYMKDHMSWELLAAKKAYQYAHQTLEPECRQLMFRVAETHQRNFERVLQHLGEHVNQSIQATTSGAQPLSTHL